MEQLPEFLYEWIKQQAKEKGHIIVGIDIFADNEYKIFKSRHGLNFSHDLYWHGLDGYKLSIEEYLTRTIKHSRKPIKIYLNGMSLNAITPNLLPAPQIPQEIDLSDTIRG